MNIRKNLEDYVDIQVCKKIETACLGDTGGFKLGQLSQISLKSIFYSGKRGNLQNKIF